MQQNSLASLRVSVLGQITVGIHQTDRNNIVKFLFFSFINWRTGTSGGQLWTWKLTFWLHESWQPSASKDLFLLQDITNLAPRKPDWDLKRDVAKKLERLERRTQKAIAELIRERLKEGQEDLVTSVNMGASASQNLDVDEDWSSTFCAYFVKGLCGLVCR